MKTFRGKATVFFFAFMVALNSCACGQRNTDGSPKRSFDVGHKAASAHVEVFVTEQQLKEFVLQTEGQCEDDEGGRYKGFGEICSGVLPHHLVAGELIARFMKILALQEPEIIVLVGPNHKHAGERVITGLYDWQTPEGIVNTQKDIVSRLLEKGLAARDEEVLGSEHSIGVVVPFLEHYLPDAEIVPLILHRDVSIAEVDRILEVVLFEAEGTVRKNVVVLGSIDFSHYLPQNEAERRDEETLDAIRCFNYPALYRFGSDHLDSPASLSFVLRSAEKNGVKDLEIVDHTNSGRILQNDAIETTSYFTLVYAE